MPPLPAQLYAVTTLPSVLATGKISGKARGEGDPAEIGIKTASQETC